MRRRTIGDAGGGVARHDRLRLFCRSAQEERHYRAVTATRAEVLTNSRRVFAALRVFSSALERPHLVNVTRSSEPPESRLVESPAAVQCGGRSRQYTQAPASVPVARPPKDGPLRQPKQEHAFRLGRGRPVAACHRLD
jgi:hypothetical protein